MRAAVTASLGSFDTGMHRFQKNAISFLKRTLGGSILQPFRTYGAFSLVASSALLVSVTNTAQQGRAPENALLGYLGVESAEISRVSRVKPAAQASPTENLSLVPLGPTGVKMDPSAKPDDIKESASIGGDSETFAAVAPSSSMTRDPKEDGGVTIYAVQPGDTVSGIAAKHGINVNTILWANDLDNIDAIKPGDEIFILPVAGLTHKIASGETIDSIAAKYKADRTQILAYNGLPANGEISQGETIVIPGGSKEIPRPEADTIRRQYATTSGAGSAVDISGGYKKLEGKAGTGHRFPYGYCTWYVAQKRYVPWGGNAGTWLYNARAMGYKTGKNPTAGSIVVTTDNRYYGHVALVEKVTGDSIVVSEMNYRAWGKTNTRTIPRSSRSIKGYIY